MLAELVKKLVSCWDSAALLQVVPSLDAVGIDLLKAMLRYEPNKRVTARVALTHRWGWLYLLGARLDAPDGCTSLLFISPGGW